MRAAALFAVAALASCSGTNLCKNGTLFVNVNLEGETAQADRLEVQVTVAGGSTVSSMIAHRAGVARGSIVVEFPAGYPMGKTVDLLIVATKLGNPVGGGVANVALNDICKAASVLVSVGKNLPDMAMEPDLLPGEDLTPLPPDLFCVFMSAEDCYNGVDDDCNGTIDCADPACMPSTTCVPAGLAFLVGTQVPTPSPCPIRYGTQATNLINEANGGANCTGCTCPATISCTATIYKYTSQSVCNADTGLTGGSSIGNISTSAPCLIAAIDTGAARVSAFSAVQGNCVATGTPQTTVPTWSQSTRFCGSDGVGGGCSPGYVCVPNTAANHCVLGQGAMSCPAGYTQIGASWYAGYTDGRSCGATCGCGPKTDGNCNGRSITTNAGSNCNGGSGYNVGGGTRNCGIAVYNYASQALSGSDVKPSCPPTYTFTGELLGSDLRTLCCL